MHLVTSSIFLPSICALISPLSRARLLKAYLAATCVWAIIRGRPLLDVKGFVEDMQRSDVRVCSGSGSETLWAKWIELAKVHPDEHLTKTIRSLSGWARIFGSRRARLPLCKKVGPVESRLVVDAGVANDQLKKDRSGKGEIVHEDVDLSPRARRDWESDTLSLPTICVQSSSGVCDSRTMSNNRVNGGLACQVSSKPSQLESLCPAGVDRTAAATGNEKDDMPSTELPGSEYLDGSLFLRVANLTFKRMGWDIRDGQVVELGLKEGEFMSEADFWDFDGISPIPTAKT